MIITVSLVNIHHLTVTIFFLVTRTFKIYSLTFLVVQCLRIHLLMQGTWV